MLVALFNATSTRESPCPLFVRIVLEVGKCIRMIYRMDSDIVATHCDILATHCNTLQHIYAEWIVTYTVAKGSRGNRLDLSLID